MTKSISNKDLVRMIRLSDILRDETSIQMARDLRILTLSHCCMTERLSFWDQLSLDKITEFENYCASKMPEGSDDLIEDWLNMFTDEQCDFILGNTEEPPKESCVCECVISADNE